MDPIGEPGRSRAAPATDLSWWLLAWLILVFFGHRWTPHPWASFVSFLGSTVAILLWKQRGPRHRPMWWVCLWGSFEGIGAGVCQGLLNWIDVKDSPAVCDSMSRIPWSGISVTVVALLVFFFSERGLDGKKAKDG